MWALNAKGKEGRVRMRSLEPKFRRHSFLFGIRVFRQSVKASSFWVQHMEVSEAVFVNYLKTRLHSCLSLEYGGRVCSEKLQM